MKIHFQIETILKLISECKKQIKMRIAIIIENPFMALAIINF